MATTGITNIGNRSGQGVTNTAGGDWSGNDPWGSGGYGGGGGGSGPTAEQRRAAGNLGGIAGYNRDTVIGAANDADEIYDIADEQNRNMRDLQTRQNKRKAGNDWYTQQQRLQSVVSQLRDQGGGAYTGSGLFDLWDMIARKDDMDDVSVLNTMRENQDNIGNNYWEAMMQSNSGRNENAMETNTRLREIVADWAAQMNNIHPDLVNGIVDAEGHTVKPPNWLDDGDWFSKNVRAALVPDEQGLYRPDTAAADAWSKGVLQGDREGRQAANAGYWDRMKAGYSRRQQ